MAVNSVRTGKGRAIDNRAYDEERARLAMVSRFFPEGVAVAGSTAAKVLVTGPRDKLANAIPTTDDVDIICPLPLLNKYAIGMGAVVEERNLVISASQTFAHDGVIKKVVLSPFTVRQLKTRYEPLNDLFGHIDFFTTTIGAIPITPDMIRQSEIITVGDMAVRVLSVGHLAATHLAPPNTTQGRQTRIIYPIINLFSAANGDRDKFEIEMKRLLTSLQRGEDEVARVLKENPGFSNPDFQDYPERIRRIGTSLNNLNNKIPAISGRIGVSERVGREAVGILSELLRTYPEARREFSV